MYVSRLTLELPLNSHPIDAANKISSGHVKNMAMNAYESVSLVSLNFYLVSSDVFGGMRPDQTYNFATHEYVSKLTLILP